MSSLPDITTVSFSSNKMLERCEKKFSYKHEEGLIARTKSRYLYFGSWTHELLEAIYAGKDWKKVHNKLKRDNWNKLFQEEKDDLGDTPGRVKFLIEHYLEYWKKDDKGLKPIQIEKYLRFPTKLGITVVMIADMVASKKGGPVTLYETKTRKNLPDSSERILQPQSHAYVFLLERLKIKVKKIIYNYLMSEEATKPRKLKDGSISEKKIETDKGTFTQGLIELKVDPKKYKKRISKLPDTVRLLRVPNTPQPQIGKMFVTEWIHRLMGYLEMRKKRKPLRSFNRNCTWDCEYYELCLADIAGKNRAPIIKKRFKKRGK